MKKNEKKLSVIVPNYNNEKFLDRSIKSLINQTYKNIEIIVVNDGSPGNSDEIVNKYKKIDDRIKYVCHEKNKGLFQARLTGADEATGDYIAFLDADDYVSVDFYRTLINNAESNNSDMVIGNTALEYDDGHKIIYTLCQMNFDVLEGDQILDNYFKQSGLNFSWHTVWNKIYKKSIWDKARKHYDEIQERLVMTEDVAFSSVLFYYAKKITKETNDFIYYCQNDSSSTAVNKIKASKEISNLKDMILSFNFVENFMKKVDIYDKYGKYFLKWKELYCDYHYQNIKRVSGASPEEKRELNDLLNKYSKKRLDDNNQGLFYSVQAQLNERLEELKKQVLDEKIKVVSFDIFDTLVVRPFFFPTDLFKLMNKEYYSFVGKSGIDFHKMRVDSEIIARKNLSKSKSKNEDITLEDIYNTMVENYGITKKCMNYFMDKEKELEIKFCETRKTLFDVYTLAINAGKKVVCTSDMYLSKKTIEKILKKNGYKDLFNIYVSSEIKKTKHTGNLFEYVIKDLKIDYDEMIHIGDNYEADYKNPKKYGIISYHVPKTTDVMCSCNNMVKFLTESLPIWQDNKESMKFIGIRTMLAMVANKYFDNPFRTFDFRTDFNSDPYLIGYYALGMYNYSITDWLLKNTCGKNDTISFMARDGYIIMKGYEILKKLYKDAPKPKYMYVSRKALIPIMISNKMDFYKLTDIMYFKNSNPKKVLQYLKDVLEYDEKVLNKLLSKNNIKIDKNFDSNVEFNQFLKLVSENFYNEEKHNLNREKLRKYFDEILEEKPAVFDVGYSGRPEYYLSSLCNKSIDTYFLNINQDEGLHYADLGDFSLHTYFDAKPTSTGNAYELLLSKIDPSCIGYKIDGDNVSPVFEEFKEYYLVDYIVNVMQDASIDFINDMYNTFGDYLNVMYYQNYYASLPIMAYINAARYEDKMILSAVEFEDDIGFGKNRKMIEDMKSELESKRQLELDKLCSMNRVINVDSGNLNYNYVDLSKKNKITRLIYYVVFDRKTLKRRINEVLYKFKRK